jgi:hypothetical protein
MKETLESGNLTLRVTSWGHAVIQYRCTGCALNARSRGLFTTLMIRENMRHKNIPVDITYQGK